MSSVLAPLSRFFAARAVRGQQSSALWSPAHWGAVSDANGGLEIDGVNVPDLVAEHGSPLMVVSRSKLQADTGRFLKAVEAAFPNSTAAFSYKTNCIPGVLRELHECGLGAEVISAYELSVAKRLGVPGDRIIVNGVNKTFEYLREAVQLRVTSINIDDPSEIELLRRAAEDVGAKARVTLRLRFDQDSHFGLCVESEQAAAVAAELAKDEQHFEFVGLHFHLLASNADPKPHAHYLSKTLDFAARLQRQYQLATRAISVGGGFAVPTVKVMSRFEYARQRLLGTPARPPVPEQGINLDRYMQTLAETLRAGCEEHGLTTPKIAFEPGRVITSQSHILLSRVHAIKSNRNGPEFAMTDAGRILTSYPCDYEYHQMFVANRMHEPAIRTYHLMGRLCTGTDWLAKFRCLPELMSGDVIAIMDAGAYFNSYSSNFGFPRPAIAMLDSGEVKMLRREETYTHLTAMDTAFGDDHCDDSDGGGS